MTIGVFPPIGVETSVPLGIAQGGTGATTAATARTNLELGDMAQQNANAVAITDGRISIGGHAATGVLDVQGSVQASDLANRYFGVRVWPTAPAGSVNSIGLRIEPATGAAVATSGHRGVSVLNPPTTSDYAYGIESFVAAGTNRYNLNIQGTAQNHFAGPVGIGVNPPSYPLDVTGQVQASALTLGGHPPTGVLDVRGSVVASDIANQYFAARMWPVAPSGATNSVGVNIEAVTGAGVASSTFYGITIKDQPASSAQVNAYHSSLMAGTNRFALNMGGTAPSYLGGSLGIGTVPTYQLDVTGNVRVTGLFGIGTLPNGAQQISISYNRAAQQGLAISPSADTGPGSAVLFTNAAFGVVGSIQTNATATVYGTSSDVRLKSAVQALGNALSTIQALRPVSFTWKADDSEGHGFLAHEVQRVIPEAITGEQDAVDEAGQIVPQQIDHSKLVPWLVAALQEAVAQVHDLTTRVTALEGASA